MMRRSIWIGLYVLTMLASGWMQGQAMVIQDDELLFLPIPSLPSLSIIIDAKCVRVTTETRVSWGCLNSPGGCYGSCSEGVYAEPASVCKPSRGSICVGRKDKIWVVKTHEGYCLSNCSCQETTPVNHEFVQIEAYRCN